MQTAAQTILADLRARAVRRPRKPFWDEAQGEKLAGVWWSAAGRSIEVSFAAGPHYGLPARLVPGVSPDDVFSASPDEFAYGVVLTMNDGRQVDFASDLVLYHCDPEYRREMDRRFPPVREPVAKRVGRRVRKLRHSRRLTLQQLADASGLTRGNASRLETGKHEPRIETLRRVAEALGVTVADLVGA